MSDPLTENLKSVGETLMHERLRAAESLLARAKAELELRARTVELLQARLALRDKQMNVVRSYVQTWQQSSWVHRITSACSFIRAISHVFIERAHPGEIVPISSSVGFRVR